MKAQVLESSSSCSIESLVTKFFDNHAITTKVTCLQSRCDFIGEISDNDIVELRNIITTVIDAMVSDVYHNVQINYKIETNG